MSESEGYERVRDELGRPGLYASHDVCLLAAAAVTERGKTWT
jgi:hypothetical protein